MKFIRKKNLQVGEELLYKPTLHWMYPVRHLVLSTPFFLLLLILWVNSSSIAACSGLGFGADLDGFIYTGINMAIKKVFLTALIVVLLVFIWRIFLYLSNEYGVTNKRLIAKRGVIRLFVAEIPTDRIESVYCTQGLLGRLLGYGTVCIGGVGGRTPVFYMVSRPYAFRRKVVEIIEKNKTLTVVHGDLPLPRLASKPEPVIKEEPMYRYGTFVRVIPGNGK